jgi:tetratricopeptide (TPR) repeat protein
MWPFRREASSGAAEKLVARGKIEAAIKMYRRVLKANPGDSSTLNRVGDLLARVDKYSEAIQLYRETAELFVEQGFYVKAIAVYKKIHRLDPGQLDVYRKLAELYTLQGLHNDARTHYEVLVDYHERQSDLPAAIGVCRKLAELQPLDPAHRTRLAELYERKGDTASVAREYLEIARLLLQRGAFEKATQVLDRALAVNSGDGNLLVEAVRLLRAEGHDDFAESFLNEAEAINVQAGRHRVVADVRERLRPEEAEVAAPAAKAPPAAEPGDGKAPSGVSIDLDEDVYVLQVDDETTALPAEAATTPQAPEDALAEIDVFVKYGFREKALDRLGDLLRADPHNLRAHQRLVELLVRDQSHRAAIEAANQMAQAAAATGQLELWREVRERLRADGFSIAGDTVKAPPTDLRDDTEEFDLLETGGPEPEPTTAVDLGSIVSEARGDSAAADDLFDLAAREADRPAPAQPSRAAAPARPAADAGQEGVDFVVVDDGEFADLAEEVEREIETAGATQVVEVEPPSVEEIVASFKQGVAENLSPEDYDTHYNLGIAYREMGLVDEAIGEFEIAIKNRDYMIGCCSLLGLCFRDKGEAERAMEWYRKGLAEPDLLEQERHALLYDLAETYETAGDLESARRTFVEISQVDGGYRDVGERLAALG